METCPGCGEHYRCLLQHYNFSPRCRPAAAEPAPRKRQQTPERDREVNARHFTNRITSAISAWCLHAHIDHYLSITELDTVRGLVSLCAAMITEFIEEELQLGAAATPTLP